MRVAVHSSGVKSWGLWEGTFSAKSLNVRPQTDNWKEPHQQNDLLISSFASFSSLSSSIILRSIHADILTEWSFQKAKRKQQQHWKCCKDAQTDNSEIDLSQFYLVHIFSFFFFFLLAQAKITSVIHISDLSRYVAGTSTSINGGKPELYTVTNPQSLKSI